MAQPYTVYNILSILWSVCGSFLGISFFLSLHGWGGSRPIPPFIIHVALSDVFCLLCCDVVAFMPPQKTDAGLVTCVYWEAKQPTALLADAADAAAGAEEEASSWLAEGCWVAYSDENYTICSCSHLSTFALILQIGDVRTKYPHPEPRVYVCGQVWLRMCMPAYVCVTTRPGGCNKKGNQ